MLKFRFLCSIYSDAAGVWLIIKEEHSHIHIHENLTHNHAHSHDDLHHNHPHDPPVKGKHFHEHTHEECTHIPPAYSGYSSQAYPLIFADTKKAAGCSLPPTKGNSNFNQTYFFSCMVQERNNMVVIFPTHCRVSENYFPELKTACRTFSLTVSHFSAAISDALPSQVPPTAATSGMAR